MPTLQGSGTRSRSCQPPPRCGRPAARVGGATKGQRVFLFCQTGNCYHPIKKSSRQLCCPLTLSHVPAGAGGSRPGPHPGWSSVPQSAGPGRPGVISPSHTDPGRKERCSGLSDARRECWLQRNQQQPGAQATLTWVPSPVPGAAPAKLGGTWIPGHPARAVPSPRLRLRREHRVQGLLLSWPRQSRLGSPGHHTWEGPATYTAAFHCWGCKSNACKQPPTQMPAH